MIFRLLLVFVAAFHADNGEPNLLSDQFEKLSVLTGDDYIGKRDEFLKQSDVHKFLAVASRDPRRSDEERWRAEILLDRARQPDEFVRLSNVWRDKAYLPEISYAITGSNGWSPIIPAGVTLPVYQVERKRGQSEAEYNFLLRQNDAYAEHRKQKQLPKSPLWTSLFGEVLLHRLGPDNAWSPAPAGVKERLSLIGKPLELGHCLADAIIVLAANKERRACREIERLVEARETNSRTRSLGIEALGRLGDHESCGSLCRVLKSPNYGDAARENAAIAIRALKCSDALETLNAVSQTEKDIRIKTEIEQAVRAIEEERAKSK